MGKEMYEALLSLTICRCQVPEEIGRKFVPAAIVEF